MEATRKSRGARVTFPDLDYHTMHELATSCFDTFNLIYPFMDRKIVIDGSVTAGLSAILSHLYPRVAVAAVAASLQQSDVPTDSEVSPLSSSKQYQK